MSNAGRNRLLALASALLVTTIPVLAVVAPHGSSPVGVVPRADGDRPILPALLGPDVWTNLSPKSAPSPRFYAPMAFDSRSGLAILFGGWGGSYASVPLNDTWTYNSETNVWTNRSPAIHPGLSIATPGTAAMVYNSHWNRVILFGGCSHPNCASPNETWAYDPGANVWTQMHPSFSPEVGHDFSLAYDAAWDRVLLFGGGDLAPHYYYNVVNGLLAYDYQGDTWTPLSPAASPSPRLGAGMVYDSVSKRTILFGGCTDALVLWPNCRMVNDTWAYDSVNNTWTNRTPPSSPPPAVGLPMVFDAVAHQVILFGGDWGTGNETWSYDYVDNDWVIPGVVINPPARYAPSMIFDAGHGRAILFGGLNSGLRNDTWSLANPGNAGGGGLGSSSEIPAIVWVGIAAAVGAGAAVVAAILWAERRRRRSPPPK